VIAINPREVVVPFTVRNIDPPTVGAGSALDRIISPTGA